MMASLRYEQFSGGSAVIVPRFSATTFWDQFERTQCTWYSAVPTIHQILLRHEHAQNVGAADSRRRDTAAKHGRIRFIRSCSAALAPATLRQLEKMFGVPVLEVGP